VPEACMTVEGDNPVQDCGWRKAWNVLDLKQVNSCHSNLGNLWNNVPCPA